MDTNVTRIRISARGNVNKLHDASLSFGQRMADGLAKRAGSWGFIIFFLGFLFVWMIANVVAGASHWDPYPFILLNLLLSCVAALQAPVIMMSQNRQADKDRIAAENDYLVNQKSFGDIESIMRHLDEQDRAILRLQERAQELLEQNARLLEEVCKGV
jgi:uncharacterized membrane protein